MATRLTAPPRMAAVSIQRYISKQHTQTWQFSTGSGPNRMPSTATGALVWVADTLRMLPSRFNLEL